MGRRAGLFFCLAHHVHVGHNVASSLYGSTRWRVLHVGFTEDIHGLPVSGTGQLPDVACRVPR